MGALAKTSIISVIFDFILVGIVAIYSPVKETIESNSGITEVLIQSSKPNIHTFFTGIGVLCFAFVCQHSAFIIASSLERPTKERWNKVTTISITVCALLSIIMGISGYLGFLGDTAGDILVNLGNYATSTSSSSTGSSTEVVSNIMTQKAANIARGLLCTTMFLVYPMEMFVARHACVVLLFKGRRAHEGHDHAVLKRRDRRIAVTTGLYLCTLLPALMLNNLGNVFALSGSLGGATLSYMGPGLMYLAVHGSEFLDVVGKRWGKQFVKHYKDTTKQHQYQQVSNKNNTMDDIDLEFHLKRSRDGGKVNRRSIKKTNRKNCICQCWDYISWYILIMPLWCRIAAHGKKSVEKHERSEARKSPIPYAFGKIIHQNFKKKRNKMKSRHPINNSVDDDDDDLNNKSMTRAGSVPAMFKPKPKPKPRARYNLSRSLHSSSSNSGSQKKKVGFAPQDSLGNDLAINEKELLLSQHRPMSAESFSAASFDVVRPGYGSSDNDNNNDIDKPQKFNSPFFVEEHNNNNNNNKNVISYDNERDVEHNSSKTHFGIDDSDHVVGEASYDEDSDERSHSSSIYVGEKVDDDMYESDYDSDGSSILVAPSPMPNSTLTTTSTSISTSISTSTTYSKYNTIKSYPIVMEQQVHKKTSIVSVEKVKDDGLNMDIIIGGEEDSQSVQPSLLEFFIAIMYIVIGFVAACGGVFSALNNR